MLQRTALPFVLLESYRNYHRILTVAVARMLLPSCAQAIDQPVQPSLSSTRICYDIHYVNKTFDETYSWTWMVSTWLEEAYPSCSDSVQLRKQIYIKAMDSSSRIEFKTASIGGHR